MSFNETTKDVDDPDILFDMIIFSAYFCGKTGQKIPVDEARECLERIKKMLFSEKNDS